jgi:hypothetical protein
MFFRLFILCSANVGALVIVLNDSPREKIGKLETSHFKRGQIVGTHSAAASATKLIHYRVYRERQFPRSCRHQRIMGRQDQRRETVDENQHWQKEIVVHGGLFRIIAQVLQHKWQQNWIFILKTLFPQKLSDISFTNLTSMVGLHLLNLRLLNVMLRCINIGATTTKPDIRQLEMRAWYG